MCDTCDCPDCLRARDVEADYAADRDFVAFAVAAVAERYGLDDDAAFLLLMTHAADAPEMIQ
jgi:hypothetical protein